MTLEVKHSEADLQIVFNARVGTWAQPVIESVCQPPKSCNPGLLSVTSLEVERYEWQIRWQIKWQIRWQVRWQFRAVKQSNDVKRKEMKNYVGIN